MKANFTMVTAEMTRQARGEIVEPCCGYECDLHGCDPGGNDRIDDAVKAGISYGIRYAMQMIAYRIRAELVCCPSGDVDTQEEALRQGHATKDIEGFHAICYWGEMGARLAEDPHSMLESPYECNGIHPGKCWNSQLCIDRKHPICEKCSACRMCEFQECCTQKEKFDDTA